MQQEVRKAGEKVVKSAVSVRGRGPQRARLDQTREQHRRRARRAQVVGGARLAEDLSERHGCVRACVVGVGPVSVFWEPERPKKSKSLHAFLKTPSIMAATPSSYASPVSVCAVSILGNKRSCLNCGSRDARFRCGACQRAFYCSQRCQACHWQTHAAVCDDYEDTGGVSMLHSAGPQIVCVRSILFVSV